MFGPILQFREQPIAVSADFEGMLMQIGIKEPCQNCDIRPEWTKRIFVFEFLSDHLTERIDCFLWISDSNGTIRRIERG